MNTFDDIENKRFVEGYIHKNTLDQVHLFPTPKDLTDYFVITVDQEIDLSGKVYNPITEMFDDMPLSDDDKKLNGVEIQGKMISLTKRNQDGLAFIEAAINKAVKVGVLAEYLPLKPVLDTKDGEVELTVNTTEEWDAIFMTWTIARNSFF